MRAFLFDVNIEECLSLLIYPPSFEFQLTSPPLTSPRIFFQKKNKNHYCLAKLKTQLYLERYLS